MSKCQATISDGAAVSPENLCSQLSCMPIRYKFAWSIHLECTEVDNLCDWLETM